MIDHPALVALIEAYRNDPEEFRQIIQRVEDDYPMVAIGLLTVVDIAEGRYT